MKKRILLVLMALTAAFCMLFALTACGDDEKENAACSHEWSGWTTKHKATCQATGEKERECKKCGEKDTDTIPKIDHTPTNVEATPATCTEKGEEAGKKCSECHTVLEGCEEIPALGHLVTEATSNGDGTHTGDCVRKDCGEKDVTVDCKYDGYAQSEDDHYKACGVCGYIDEATKETHTVAAWTDNENGKTHTGKCSECDKEVTKSHNPEWKKDDGEHWQECKDCDYATEKEDHETEFVSDGDEKHHRECETCGYKTQTEEHTTRCNRIDENTHREECDFCEYAGDVEPHAVDGTWKSKNTRQHEGKCLCGENLTEEHELVWDWTEEDEHYQKCASCSYQVAAEAHTSTRWINDGENGHHQVCAKCEKTYNRADMHTDMEAWQSDGTKHYRECSDCDYRPGTGKHVTTSAAWTKDTSSHYQTCETCDLRFNEANHSYTTPKVVDDAQDAHDGEQYQACVCGAVQGTMTYYALRVNEEAESVTILGIGNWQMDANGGIEIPARIHGKPVTKIETLQCVNKVGNGDTTLTQQKLSSIYIPASVEEIGDLAFDGMYMVLRTITFEENSHLRKIGSKILSGVTPDGTFGNFKDAIIKVVFHGSYNGSGSTAEDWAAIEKTNAYTSYNAEDRVNSTVDMTGWDYSTYWKASQFFPATVTICVYDETGGIIYPYSDPCASGHLVESWTRVTGTEQHSGECPRCSKTITEDCNGGEWTSDETSHHRICEDCGEIYAEGTHEDSGYTEWEITGDLHVHSCLACGEQFEGAHDDGGDTWHSTNGSAVHWKACTICGAKINGTEKEHNVESWSESNGNHAGTCVDCKVTVTGAHTYEKDKYESVDSQYHWQICDVCGSRRAGDPQAKSEHKFIYTNEGASGHAVTCEYCDYEAHQEHTGGSYVSGEETHYQECVCKYRLNEEAHNWVCLSSNGGRHTKECENCKKKVENETCTYSGIRFLPHGIAASAATKHVPACDLEGCTSRAPGYGTPGSGENHIYEGDSQVCSKCGYEKPAQAASIALVETTVATRQEDMGTITYPTEPVTLPAPANTERRSRSL